MPARLNAPVLTLDAAKMHQIDPRNVESLFGMWTVFSKCSHNIKDGTRLENMSWRIWARETLCCPPQPERSVVPAIDIPAGHSSEVPSLSNSPASSDDSASDDDRRKYSRDDEETALSKSRGNETHLTATTLEKIVVDIQEKPSLEPLPPSIEASLSPPTVPEVELKSQRLHSESEEQSPTQLQNSTDSCISGTTESTLATYTTRESEHRNSDTSVSSDGLIRSGSVVHGFSPASGSFKAKAIQGLPMPSSKLAPAPLKKSGMFQLGVSSEDEESSFESKLSSFRPAHRPSSLSQSVNKPLEQLKASEKKHPSFRDIVNERKMDSASSNDEGAIADSDEDESAIDDDEDDEDGDDWEDSQSEDERAAPPEPTTFRRVDSRPDLVSRPSMLSMAIQERRRTSNLSNENSKSSPAFRRARLSSQQDPSLARSPDENEEEGMTMGTTLKKALPPPTTAKTQPKPIIMTTTNNQSMAHSPRTTRRNMLSTELTESLRKNLLWERQQKSQTANAFLKRTRNAQSMANLPAAAGPSTAPAHGNNKSWNSEFENPWEFNAKGW